MPKAAAVPTLLRVLQRNDMQLGARLYAIRGLALNRASEALPQLEALAGIPQERPVLPPPTLTGEAQRRATLISLAEQERWQLKIGAQAAIDHIHDPTRPLYPDSRQMLPLRYKSPTQ
jgi:hypothetical protein